MADSSPEITPQIRFNALVDHFQQYFDHTGESNAIKDLSHFLLYDPTVPYTRNLIKEGPGYALMALCWGKDKESPVHDHPGCECLVAVVAGQLLESVYEWPQKGDTMHTPLRPRVAAGGLLLRSGVSHMSDVKGLHKLGQFGPSANIPCRHGDTGEQTECAALSLHLYLPPYQQCRLFPGATAAHISGSVGYYSRDGERQSHLGELTRAPQPVTEAPAPADADAAGAAPQTHVSPAQLAFLQRQLTEQIQHQLQQQMHQALAQRMHVLQQHAKMQLQQIELENGGPLPPQTLLQLQQHLGQQIEVALQHAQEEMLQQLEKEAQEQARQQVLHLRQQLQSGAPVGTFGAYSPSYPPEMIREVFPPGTSQP